MSNLKETLDIGISSVGWAVVDQDTHRLVEMGERIFETAAEASEPRQKRSSRRNTRRNRWRRNQMKTLLLERSLITQDEYDDPKFMEYTGNNKYERPEPDTIYHLRAKALKEKVSKRELALCLYNLCKTRGHFLLETIDFSRDGVTYDDFRERFYSYVSGYIEFKQDTSKFEEIILKKLYGSELGKKNSIKQLFTEHSFTEGDDQEGLINLVYFLKGYKSNLNLINEECEPGTFNAMDLKKNIDDLNEFEENIIELFDLIRIAKVLSDGCNYLCEVQVRYLDSFKKAFLDGKENPAIYEEAVREVKAKCDRKAKHVRALRNMDNDYPNGLYVKEAVDILKCQQSFYPEIDDTFIEICSSIISARIPYYIGPLSENGKNAWVKKNNTFKYSYDYSVKHLNSVDEFESIKEWKMRMISHCTYLPEYVAMPKGSFVGETFSILNELNSFDNSTIDSSGQRYCLTKQDKIQILDKLFLKKSGNVTFGDVKELLNLKYFGSKNGTSVKFNNKYTLCKNIGGIIERLKVNSVMELFEDKGKIDELEQIIMNINLFNEEKSKLDYFSQNEKYSPYAKKLAKLKSTSFFSISREFIMDEKVDPEGNSIMKKLLEDNQPEYTNNMMYIIYNAHDHNGEKIDYVSNKYIRMLKENGCKLDIDLLLDNGKPVIPVSRPTIRALNEAFKVHTAIIETYGVPSRMVIETARGKDSIKDHATSDEKGEEKAATIKKLYNHLVKRISEENYEDRFLKQVHTENSDEIETMFNRYKEKVELYVRQNGIDLITGKIIDLTNLNEYQIDHILPRGFGDDSMDDKMLIHKLTNEKKSDRLPIEFLESSDGKEFTSMTVTEYEKLVNGLYNIDMISQNKRNRLLLRNSKDVEGFVNQNLVDTRYIIREFMSAVKAYNSINNYDTKIVALKGAFTYSFRKAFNIDKDRNLGNQHHAIDAAMLCVTDDCLSAYFPHYDERGDFKAYSEFIKESIINEERNHDTSKDKNRNTILRAYYKAYGHDYKTENSLINQIKRTVPLYSHKVEKNWRGPFTDETLMKPLEHEKEDNRAPLSIIGMNNSKRSFTSVNCVAADFYKIRTKDGKTQHVAVHIPYAIVDYDGNIMKDKYLALVKEHYKIPELIDENGNLNERFFRFRAFKNDIIYDTCTNTPQLFNIGSIALKKLSLKHIANFSYDSIYTIASEMAYLLAKRFNIRYGKNRGIEFKEISINRLIHYANENLCEIRNFAKYEEALKEQLRKEKTLISFCRKYVYLAIIASRNNVPKSITGLYLPVANNNVIKNDKDAEYIKLKYDILGLRFDRSENGKLIINSARGTCGKYTKVKKEKFEWKISKYVVK